MAMAEPVWTAEQCRWLRALDLEPWVVAGHGLEEEEALPMPRAEPAPPADVPANARPSVPVAPQRGTDPGRARHSPSLPGGETPGEAAAMPTRLDMSDPLFRALLRATRCRTPREGQAMLARVEVAPEAMRADPAAKRVAWQRLRRLRRAGA